MRTQTVDRIIGISFVTALVSIAAGVGLGILGVWDVIPGEQDLLWRLLASDAIIFAGSVLTNLAGACYRKPGGALV